MSFKKVTTLKLDIEISGNFDGITSSVVVFLWSKPWEEVKMTRDEIIDYYLAHPKGKAYMKDKYFAVKEISRNKLLETEFGISFHHVGIGSYSTEREKRVELKKDKFGNLLISESTMIWD